MSALVVGWVDLGREPECAPNPKYPTGIDLDLSGGATRRCETALPYPAKRCGYFTVKCVSCELQVAVTTAGRADDPRSVIVACKRPEEMRAWRQ